MTRTSTRRVFSWGPAAAASLVLLAVVCVLPLGASGSKEADVPTTDGGDEVTRAVMAEDDAQTTEEGMETEKVDRGQGELVGRRDGQRSGLDELAVLALRRDGG